MRAACSAALGELQGYCRMCGLHSPPVQCPMYVLILCVMRHCYWESALPVLVVLSATDVLVRIIMRKDLSACQLELPPSAVCVSSLVFI